MQSVQFHHCSSLLISSPLCLLSAQLTVCNFAICSVTPLLVPTYCSAHHCASHLLSSQFVFCNLFSYTTARPCSLFSSPLCLLSAQLTDCNSAICSVSPLLVPNHCSAHHCACHLLSSQFVILQSVQFHHCSSLLSVQLTTVPAICSAHR